MTSTKVFFVFPLLPGNKTLKENVTINETILINLNILTRIEHSLNQKNEMI